MDVDRQCERVRGIVSATVRRMERAHRARVEELRGMGREAAAAAAEAQGVISTHAGGESVRVSSISGDGIPSLLSVLKLLATRVPTFNEVIPRPYEAARQKVKEWQKQHRVYVTRYDCDLSNQLSISVCISSVGEHNCVACTHGKSQFSLSKYIMYDTHACHVLYYLNPKVGARNAVMLPHA